MPCGFDRKSLGATRRHGHIEVDWLGRDAIHGTALAPEVSAYNSNSRAIVVLNLRNFRCFHFLVARRGHLERGGKVRPQLESMHAASSVALGHLLMDDPASRRHPLHFAGGDGA